MVNEWWRERQTVDKWVTRRKQGGRSGVCLAVTQWQEVTAWLNRMPHLPRDKEEVFYAETFAICLVLRVETPKGFLGLSPVDGN